MFDFLRRKEEAKTKYLHVALLFENNDEKCWNNYVELTSYYNKSISHGN